MASSTTPASEGIQRKRMMRKGTKSCLECRTRKIRCNFPTGSRQCTSCKAHGKTCIEQTYHYVKEAGLDKRVGLKDRVKELEALVNQLMDKGDGKVEIPERYRKRMEEQRQVGPGMMSPPESCEERSRTSGTGSPSTRSTAQLAQNAINDIYDAVEDLDDIDSGEGLAKSTMHGLFDNAILSHDPIESTIATPPDSPSLSRKRKAHAWQIHFANELRALIPKPADLKILLDPKLIFEPIWRHSLSPDCVSSDTMESVMLPYLHSDRLILVCKGLLYLALLLQQLPPDSLQHNLEFPDGLSGKELIQRYIDTVDAYLMSSDKILSSLDGLECTTTMSQLLINDGRPRKAWTCFQRSISYAKLLGYFRPSSWKTDDNDTKQVGKRRQRLWQTLYQGDRYLCVLLGLPYTIPDTYIDIDSVCSYNPGQPIDTDTFLFKLSVITGHITDRNHKAASQSISESFASAMALDGELHSLACMVPASWWETSDIPSGPDDEIFEFYRRSKAIFWHNECRLLLHMPYMLATLRKPDGNSGGKSNCEGDMYAYNRTVALNASREMIRTHNHLRKRREFAALVCQVIDFQVFTAAMLLLLDLLQRPDLPLEEDKRSKQTLDDTALIVSVTATLRKVSKESSGRCDIAGQAVNVLDGVAHVLYGCPSRNETNPSRVVIPYFGAVTIKPVGGKQRCKCCPPSGGMQGVSMEDRQDAAAKAVEAKSASEGHTEYSSTMSPQSQGFVSQQRYPQQHQQLTPPPFSSNDFITFDSFLGTGTGGTNQMALDGWSTVNQPGPQQDGLGTDMGLSGQDVTMWDENIWQSMLQQDPNLDMDGGWNWLQV